MEHFQNITRYDIEKALTPEQLRITQIVLFAILTGSILFLVPVNIINSTKAAPLTPVTMSEFGQQYIYIVAAVALFSYSVVYFFAGFFLSQTAITAKIESAGPFNDNAQAAFFLITMDRNFRIIKNAIFEGVSMVAIVGIFIELTHSDYQLSGDIWLLTLPIVIHVLYLMLHFPKKETIINDIEKDILSKLNL